MLTGQRRLHLLGTFWMAASGVVFGANPDPIIPASSAPVRIERSVVPGGGELFTFFKRVSDPSDSHSRMSEVPFISVLRDTMGDDVPENDRFRDVWALTYARPSLSKRAAAAIPFLYRRAGSAKVGKHYPPPLVDLAAAGRGTFPRVGGALLQSAVLDPLGMRFRATTRAYRSRVREYRDMHLWRTMELLGEPAGSSAFNGDELDFVRGRVLLRRNVFGGWVDDRYVVPAWKKFERSVVETRGRNWELLRQRAEDNGLYFEPVELGRGGASFALLWMEQSGHTARPARFDSKFLSIADPFTDARIRNWSGYSAMWKFDSFGSRVTAGDGAVREARMIPLALYSLEHRKVPLMLVDFRDPGKPRRREMLRRATDDVATGVLGWTGFGNWAWLAVRTSFSFVHGRRGSPLDRDARVRAYVQVRQALTEDSRIEPDLRRALIERLEKLGMNPFDNASKSEQEIALRQYATLMDSVESGVVGKHLDKQRVREAQQVLHSRGSRVLRRFATAATFGIYRSRAVQTPELLAVVDRQRRMSWHRRYLEEALAAGPQAEVSASTAALNHSISELSRLTSPEHPWYPRVRELIAAVLSGTADEGVREVCRASLTRLDSGAAPAVAAAGEQEPVKTAGGGQ